MYTVTDFSTVEPGLIGSPHLRTYYDARLEGPGAPTGHFSEIEESLHGFICTCYPDANLYQKVISFSKYP